MKRIHGLFANLSVICASLFFSGTVFASDAHFEAGSQYSITALHGDLSVTCRGAQQHIRCDDLSAEPAFASVLIGPVNGADRVEIVGTSGARSVKKKQDYDGAAGRTEDRVNLLIATLFQKPLLTTGDNKITVSFKKEGRTIETSEFNVGVTDNGHLFCRRRYYYEPSECFGNSARRFCDRYFYDTEVSEDCR